MARLSEQEFKKQLSSGDLPQVCLICGDEDYLKKHYASQLEKKSVDEAMASFNMHRINGDNFVFDELYQAVQSMPFMSDYSCVSVKDLNIEKMKKDEFELLLDLIGDPNESCVLLFRMDGVDVDEKKERTKTFVDAVDEVGTVLRLDKMSGTQLFKLLENGASKRGCEMSRDVSSYLANRVGDDLNTLLNELEKVCFYKGEGETTRRDVDAICTRSLDASVFDLSKALVGGTAQQAFNILNDLLAQKEKPVAILGTLINAYVDMYRAQVALSSGESADAAAKVFNYKRREFRLKNGARSSANMSLAQIRDCLDILADADTRLKSTSLDERRILEELMLRLMLIS
ncbi:MAG: DNA polymerase III subunit delta [Clostridia bacterium]|nr:DNA polymerase III subunit delta [Clostridia bacterium]